MAEEAPGVLERILELLASAGFDVAVRSSPVSLAEKVAAGIGWCIDARVGPLLRDETRVFEGIEEALKSIGCPFPVEAHQIADLDYEVLYPVVQWLVGCSLEMNPQSAEEWLVGCSLEMNPQSAEEGNSAGERMMVIAQDKYQFDHERQDSVKVPVFTANCSLADELHPVALDGGSLLKKKVTSLLSDIGEREINIQQLEKALFSVESTIRSLEIHSRELDKKKTHLLGDIRQLHDGIDEASFDDTVQNLIRMLELLEALAPMQSEILDLEENKSGIPGRRCPTVNLDCSLNDASNKLNSVKKELAAKLRAILSVKRQLDDVPIQAELIQYERRFSELYVQIQEKLRQTRKHYGTYNTLLEIKELMLKETSLLNSISSQFQDAMTSTIGRAKLVDSMEAIVKGTQQKLEKVNLTLHAELKILDSLKEKYAGAIAEQRHFYSLLKAFQEECTRNEMLRGLASM